MTCALASPQLVVACMLVGQIAGMTLLCTAFALKPQKLLRWIRNK